MAAFQCVSSKRGPGATVRRLLALLPFVAGLLPGPARAGGWTQPAGGAYLRLEGAGRYADQMFDPTGALVDLSVGGGPAEFRNFELRGYAEYGAAPGWTVIAGGTWKRATIEEAAATFETRGFGDLKLGLRGGLSQGGAWPMALEGEVTIPTGYDPEEIPALGTGRMEATLSLQVGHSFRGGYFTADAGYRVRGHGLSDQVPLNAQLGLEGPGALAFRLGGRARVAFDPVEVGSDPTVAEDSVWDLIGTLVWATGRSEIEAGVTDTVAGKNAIPGPEFFLALAVRH